MPAQHQGICLGLPYALPLSHTNSLEIKYKGFVFIELVLKKGLHYYKENSFLSCENEDIMQPLFKQKLCTTQCQCTTKLPNVNS